MANNVKMKKLHLKVWFREETNRVHNNVLLKPLKDPKIRLFSYTEGFFKKLMCASQIFSIKPGDL